MKKISLLTLTLSALLIGNVLSAQTITGSGTTNMVPKFTGTTTIGNSLIYDSGTRIGINTTSPGAILQMNSSGPNDGLRVYQTTTFASSLQLWHTSLANGAHNWNIYSTDISNATLGGAGNLIMYDYTSSTVPLLIKGTTGLVGIGNIAPTERLDVSGGNMIVRGPTGFASAGSNATFYLGNNTNYINAINGGNIDFAINGTSMISMTQSLRVGIGTMTPGAMLNVHNGALLLSGSVPGVGGPQLFFSDTQTQAQWAEEYTTSAYMNGLNFWRPFGATGTVGNYFLFLGNNGHVGVNTDNPTAQLTVNGKTLIGDPAVVNISTPGNYNLYVQNGILTEKVRVAVNGSANWADYVFAPDYKLMPLNEVANFVTANHHLPDVPSACEVEDGGIDLAQMDATLLKKVEELTLYVIDQDKKIAAQQQQILDLQQQAAPKH